MTEFDAPLVAEIVHAMGQELTGGLVAEFGGRFTSELVAAFGTTLTAKIVLGMGADFTGDLVRVFGPRLTGDIVESIGARDIAELVAVRSLVTRVGWERKGRGGERRSSPCNSLLCRHAAVQHTCSAAFRHQRNLQVASVQMGAAGFRQALHLRIYRGSSPKPPLDNALLRVPAACVYVCIHTYRAWALLSQLASCSSWVSPPLQPWLGALRGH